jgi:hypothetical protein
MPIPLYTGKSLFKAGPAPFAVVQMFSLAKSIIEMINKYG